MCRAGEGRQDPRSRTNRPDSGEQAAGPHLDGLPSGDAGGHQGRDALQLWRAAAAGRGLPARGRVVRRYDGKNGAEVDAAIVATYLMQAAENEGLATLWVGSFDPALLRDILPGTEGYELVAMINVGYPAPDSQPSAMHGERKTVGELVTRVE